MKTWKHFAAFAAVAAVFLLIVVGASTFIEGKHHAKPKPAPRQLVTKQISAREAGREVAQAVNGVAGGPRLRPALCAHLQGRRYSCSFYQANPKRCRYVKFDLINGEVIPRVSGLVPETFCPERVR